MEIALLAYLDVAIRCFVDSVAMKLDDGMVAHIVREMEREVVQTTDEMLKRLSHYLEVKCEARE